MDQSVPKVEPDLPTNSESVPNTATNESSIKINMAQNEKGVFVIDNLTNVEEAVAQWSQTISKMTNGPIKLETTDGLFSIEYFPATKIIRSIVVPSYHDGKPLGDGNFVKAFNKDPNLNLKINEIHRKFLIGLAKTLKVNELSINFFRDTDKPPMLLKIYPEKRIIMQDATSCDVNSNLGGTKWTSSKFLASAAAAAVFTFCDELIPKDGGATSLAYNYFSCGITVQDYGLLVSSTAAYQKRADKFANRIFFDVFISPELQIQIDPGYKGMIEIKAKKLGGHQIFTQSAHEHYGLSSAKEG